ncbi:uncharacterized protein A4U43_C04F28070 [Asparagus officinalis]|uniref:Uncharacterized protein n=1 Tax=Asparagus officinalis TaxID=4686 RepID=A0A5P1F6Y9_ASPOF|nr:uncharacterized protein A4U43_C04F28070 [Asparagus officinalis]
MALFVICWVMERSWRVGNRNEAAGAVPDFKHLVMSVLVVGREVEDDERIWGCEVLGMDRSVSAQKVENELPEKIERLVRCEASTYQKLLMKRVEENLGSIRNTKGRSVHNTVMELHNICNHPYLDLVLFSLRLQLGFPFFRFETLKSVVNGDGEVMPCCCYMAHTYAHAFLRIHQILTGPQRI